MNAAILVLAVIRLTDAIQYEGLLWGLSWLPCRKCNCLSVWVAAVLYAISWVPYAEHGLSVLALSECWVLVNQWATRHIPYSPNRKPCRNC